MKTVTVGGRFVHADGTPATGRIKFIPSKIWIDDADGKSYPTLAPEVPLVEGRSKVEVTRTDTFVDPWFYTVVTPVGTHTIWIETDGPINLRDLLPKHLT